MKKAQEMLFAVVGAGDAAVDKVRDIRKLATRKTTSKVYKDFVKRGRTLTTKVRNAAPTKRAVAQTKTARTQVKAAATSVRKAVGANVDATQSAAQEAVQAS